MEKFFFNFFFLYLEFLFNTQKIIQNIFSLNTYRPFLLFNITSLLFFLYDFSVIAVIQWWEMCFWTKMLWKMEIFSQRNFRHIKLYTHHTLTLLGAQISFQNVGSSWMACILGQSFFFFLLNSCIQLVNPPERTSLKFSFNYWLFLRRRDFF